MAEEKDNRLDLVLMALADPTRRAILARLTEGSTRVTDLAGPYNMSLNAISKHIQVLERAGLVRRDVQGREHVLTFNGDPLTKAADWMDLYRGYWEKRIDQFAKRRTRRVVLDDDGF